MARDKNEWKKFILENLDKYGRSGSTKSALKVKSTPAEEAFSELLKDKEIVPLGSQKRQLLFRTGLVPNAESVKTELIEKLSHLPPKLFTATELGSATGNTEKARIAKTLIPQLVKDGILFEIKRGSTLYLIFLASMDETRGIARPNKNTIDPNLIAKAYKDLVSEEGFSAVSIASLSERCSTELETLKTYLMAEAKANRAELSEGDWSVSSDFVRTGAIPFRGKKLLNVEIHG